MKERISSGTDTFHFTDLGCDGVNLHIRMISNDFNVAPDGIDLSDVRVKIIQVKHGEKHVIVPSTEVLPLMLDALTLPQFKDGLSTNNTPSTSGVLVGDTVVTESALAKGETQAFVPIRFSGGIVCKGKDDFMVEISIGGSAWSANCDNDSYMMVEPNYAVTNQTNIPFLKVFPISSNESRFAKSFGDNVQTLSIISVDKDNEDKNLPFTEIDFESDRLSYDRTYHEHRSVFSSVSSDLEDRSIIPLIHGPEFDKVKLTVTLASGNVTNGKCFAVVRAFDYNEPVMREAVERKEKHLARAQKKFVS